MKVMRFLKIAVLIMPLIIGYCAEKRETIKGALASKKPEIKLFAHPRQGFMPLTIFFEAQLINYEKNPEAFKCLVEKWDFGDGSKSEHQPNCSETLSIKTKFMTNHLYTRAGNFRVQFTLGEKDNAILSNVLWVNILSSGIDRNRQY